MTRRSITRRELLLYGTIFAAGTAAGVLLLDQSDSPKKPITSLEESVLKDFSTYTPTSDLSLSDIEAILFDIETRKERSDLGRTRGRAIEIGDGLFLTAYHVVDPSRVKKGETLKLVPQHRRGYVMDFARNFSILAYDKTGDVAVLKAHSESPTGKAKVHLFPDTTVDGNVVSIFLRLTGRPQQSRYELSLVGKDYYNNVNKIEMGKIILPENSLLLEYRGQIMPYRRDFIMKTTPGDLPIPMSDGNFSSLLSYNGYSGSPVFVRLRNGRYALAGIVTSAWQIENSIQTPNHPLDYEAVSQTGTIFAHRTPIIRLISKYTPSPIGK